MFMMLLGLSTILSLVYEAWVCNAPISWLRTAVKTGAILCLAALALNVGAPVLLVAALGGSALGDFFLSRDGDKAFLAGMAAFFAGHVAYIALFVTLGDGVGVIAARWQVPVALLVFAAGVYAYLWPDLEMFRLPVAGYSVAIAAMGITAISLPLSGWFLWIVAGAGFFILSDTILAAEKFRPPKVAWFEKLAPHLVWLFYWGAQVMITLGVIGVIG